MLVVGITLAACAGPPCAEGFARTAEGRCLPVAGNEDGNAGGGGGAAVAMEPLAAPRLARRMSLDLRGVLPSAGELAMVESDPTALTTLQATWLADPRLEERLVHLFAAVWHTRIGRFEINHYEYDALRDDPTIEYAFERGVGEEPLRLMARVGTADEPWTDILTTDRTRLPPVLTALWPVEVLEEGDGWRDARYTDGRPAAGVLATNGLWWRYSTSKSNKNRTRAAAIARLLVCVDLLDREVSVERLGATEVEEAVRTAPECVGCHSALDPVAATLSGFTPINAHSGPENQRYHPERELDGAAELGVQPAWFGSPVQDLGALGAAVAADPRFLPCTVRQLAQGLWARPPRPDDTAELRAVQADFEAGDLRLTVALRSLVSGATYRAGSQGEGGTEVTGRWLWPDQLASSIEDTTGFRWTWEGFEVLDDDTLGYRVLLGGVEGVATTEPQARPGLAMVAVWKRVAEAAADHAVVTELVAGEPGAGLFAGLTLADAPGDPAFDSGISQLRWRLLAVRDPVAEADLAALWSAVEVEHGPAHAWRAVVAALLREPLFVMRWAAAAPPLPGPPAAAPCSGWRGHRRSASPFPTGRGPRSPPRSGASCSSSAREVGTRPGSSIRPRTPRRWRSRRGHRSWRLVVCVSWITRGAPPCGASWRRMPAGPPSCTASRSPRSPTAGARSS